jgi:hypothetical protein
MMNHLKQLLFLALITVPLLALAQAVAVVPAGTDPGLDTFLAAFNAHNWPLLAGLLVGFASVQIQKGAWNFDFVSESFSHWLHSVTGAAVLALLGGLSTALIDGAVSGWSWGIFLPGALTAVVGFAAVLLRQLPPTAGKVAAVQAKQG